MNIKWNHIFEPELLNQIEKHGILTKAKEGEVIVEIGQWIKQIPLLISGSIKVYRHDNEGNEILLYFLNENETCAMTFTCCMQNQVSEVKAVASDEIEFLLIPTDVMDKWLCTYPTWKNFVMNTMKNRFNELLRTIDQIAFQNLDSRLENYLKEVSKQSGSKLLNVSHEKIAQELATSRVVISRLLKKLENDKKLLLYRTQIRLMTL